ncbi:MAG: hypothetical protein D6732_26895 [Methanobacteriota archaeon]|nr:MAG: hypothetical protein D6732_26895 [Euryarchaeota archaeon]
MQDWQQNLRKLKEEWDDFPTIKAAVIVAAGTAGLVTLNNNLPEQLSYSFDEESRVFAFPILVTVWALLVAIFSGDRLRFEKKMRLLEQNYKYDHRGTLFNGSQPNIAFRIETFKEILTSMQENTHEDMSAALKLAGSNAGAGFAETLEAIYNSDVAKWKGHIAWEHLNLPEKLNRWADYDSATGWGIVSVQLNNKNVIKVTCTHYNGLLDGDGGTLFGNFLSGYFESVISHIVKGHTHGTYNDYLSCEIVGSERKSPYTIEFNYKLK